MELILIRHSETAGNRERRFIGVTDEPITPEGAALARRRAADLPRVEHVYRSGLIRCRETADLLFPGVAQTTVAQLRETDFGPFEGKCHRELEADPLYLSWLSGVSDAGTEPFEAAGQRALEGLAVLCEDARRRGFSRVAVVSHGGTLMAILAAFGTPPRAYYDWKIPNCGGFRAAVREEPFALEILDTY